MKTEIVKTPKQFKPFTVKLTFEKKSEVENLINDLKESYDEDISFSELNPLFNMLKDELKKLNE